jgi:hypothetical protein
MKITLALVSALYILANIIQEIHCNLYFHRVGWMVGEPSYGHVHFSIDTHSVMTHLTDLKLAIASMRKQIHEIPHPAVRSRAETFLKHAHDDINDITHDFIDVLHLLGSSHSSKTRTKRFLSLLVAIGSLSMSIFNQAEILHLQSSMSNVIDTQHQLVNILQEHETAIHEVQHDISKIRDGFLILINEAEETHAMVKIHDAEIRIVMAISTLRQTISCIGNGIEKLLTNRVPLCFLSSVQTEKALNGILDKGRKLGLEMVSPHLASFLQYETSFLIVQNQIHIYVHVPLFNPTRRMDLLKFSNAPIPILPTLSFAFAPTEEYLGIDTNGLHATISQHQVSTSKKYGEYFFSESAIVMKKNLSSTCLGSIYSQNYKTLKSTCPAIFIKTTEAITTVAQNEYILITKTPQTIQVKCQGKTEHIAVDTELHLKLNQPCEVTTKEHVIQTGYDLSVNEEVKKWPMNWNVTEHLFGLESHALESIVEDLKLIKDHPTPIRDLHQLINNLTHKTTNTITLIVLTTLALVLLGMITFLIVRYCHLRKQNKTIANGA